MSGDGAASSRRDPEARWQDRLAVPVLVAALASVPAVFLSLLDGAAGTVGEVVNWVSGGVLVAETVVLFVVSRDRRGWLRRHGALLALTAAVVLALVFALGPAQLLRLVRVFGALRIVRAGRILRAARTLRHRAGLDSRWSRAATALAAALAAAFVGVVLADPTSRTRELLASWFGIESGPAATGAVLLAGALLAAATFVVARQQGGDEEES